MPSFLITGSSRGIGLALVTELLKDPQNFVVATARNPSGSKGLQDLAKKCPKEQLVILPLDTSDPEQIIRSAKSVEEMLPGGLDYLINNAGITLQSLVSFEDLDTDLLAQELLFNTVPILRILKAYKPLIVKSKVKKVITMTSELGSLELAASTPGLANTYSISKAALNMLMRKWGAAHKQDGIITVLVHPGWVATDMGREIEPYVSKNAPGLKPITVEESASGVVKLILGLEQRDGVPFLSYDGTTVPW